VKLFLSFMAYYWFHLVQQFEWSSEASGA